MQNDAKGLRFAENPEVLVNLSKTDDTVVWKIEENFVKLEKLKVVIYIFFFWD